MIYQVVRKAKIQSTSGHPKPFIVFRSAKLTPVSGDTKFQPGDTVQIWFDSNIGFTSNVIDTTKHLIRKDKSDPGEIWSWLSPAVVLTYLPPAMQRLL